jgi:L-threonine kinase
VDELCATSTVSLDPEPCQHRVVPADRTRALTAAEELASALGLGNTHISVEIESNIPVGRGCASSTADIMASVAALLEAAHPEVPDPVVHALGSLVAKEIEWGDYVFSESIALCRQRTHTLVRQYDTGMRWRIVGVEEGGSVDTEAFHRRQRESRRQAQYYETLLAQMDAALSTSDFTTAAQIATESALMNQKALPKRNLALMRRIADATGALGIAIAHTGTVIGLIFSAHQSDASLRLWEARQRLKRANLTSKVFTVREGGTVNGNGNGAS